MMNSEDVSEYLKLSADGLEVSHLHTHTHTHTHLLLLLLLLHWVVSHCSTLLLLSLSAAAATDRPVCGQLLTSFLDHYVRHDVDMCVCVCVCVCAGALWRVVVWECAVYIWSVGQHWLLVLWSADHYCRHHADWLRNQRQQVPQLRQSAHFIFMPSCSVI